MNIDSIGQISVVGGSPTSRTIGKAVSPADGDFAAMLGSSLTSLADQLRNAEAVSVAGIKGQVPTQAVVEQVMAAEQTLQASIAIRDKIIAAYLEISRMAI
jgi:flagellar hook-basal body complex protein FliE